MKSVPSTSLVLAAAALLGASFPVLRPETTRGAGGPAASRVPGDPAVALRQKITTFLWFDDDAEEAIRFYGSIFEDSAVLEETRWGAGGPLPEGTLMSARFRLAGQQLMALNGGPLFKFNEAVSLFVSCKDQAEVDRFWEKLGKGGEPGRCGWLKDRFGLSWQVVPEALGRMLGDSDPARRKRVSEAMLAMGKIDLRRLQEAYDGK